MECIIGRWEDHDKRKIRDLLHIGWKRVQSIKKTSNPKVLTDEWKLSEARSRLTLPL
jgi:hypothetical protein